MNIGKRQDTDETERPTLPVELPYEPERAEPILIPTTVPVELPAEVGR